MAACDSDAIVAFKTPFRGQQVLTLIGAEQTTGSLEVMIVFAVKYHHCTIDLFRKIGKLIHRRVF